jgi:hypothetical protein
MPFFTRLTRPIRTNHRVTPSTNSSGGHEYYGEVCLGESYRGQFGIPVFGWRQTMPNRFAEKQIRPLPCREHSA